MLTEAKKARIFDSLPVETQFFAEQLYDARRVGGPNLTIASLDEFLRGDGCVRYKGRRMADIEVSVHEQAVRWSHRSHLYGTVHGFVSLSAAYRDLISRLREGGFDV